MPIPVPALLLGGGVIAALLLLNKQSKAAEPGAPALPPRAPAAPGAPPILMVPVPPKPPVTPGTLPPLPGSLFPALPFPGRPPPITVAERDRIIAKPPGTLTAADVANLTVDFTPAQTAVLNTIGTPGLVKPNEASPQDVSEAIRQGVPLDEFLKRTGGPILQPRAMVTTSDPSPGGDLKVLSAPSASAGQIGGAPKGGIVTVMNMDASPEFAEIIWGGGFGFPAVVKYPGVRGFVKKKFLVIQ